MPKFSTFLHENIFFIAVLALVIVVYLIFEFKQRSGGAKCLSPKLTASKMNEANALVIDIRAKDQFATGHIIHAKNIELATLKVSNQLPKNKAAPIIITCDRGTTAKRAVPPLRSMGYTDISVLEGGIFAWRKENFPIVSKSKKGK